MTLVHFRRILSLLFLPLWVVTVSHARQNPQAVFNRANEQLEEGRYREAISLYRQLEKQEQWSGALFLNLGISYQRIDSLGKAKYYFLRAGEFEETESSAREAVKYINGRFSHQSATLPKLPWDVATDWLRVHIGAPALLAWGIILLNIGILVFISRWFIRAVPSFAKTAGIIIAGAGILVAAAGFYTRYIETRYSQAVMITQKSPVLEHPRKESSLVSQAFEGYTFTVDHSKSSERENWSYVRMSNGLYGWIPNSEILIL